MEKTLLKTDKAPEAIGPYSQAVKVGNLMFISGQLPLNPIDGKIVDGGVQEQTKQCVTNLKAICEAAGATLGDVVKTTIFVTDMTQFAKVNETYGEFFETDAPARACVEVSCLPKDALIEIEAVVYIN
ncbi:MAG: RidA family protein [Firmicutes bacterium]|nr:RidA family protein [Bacillota bacterium]